MDFPWMGGMAGSRPRWLAELSTAFKRHRQGRPGWFVEVSGDRLRIRTAELPPRPDEPAEGPRKRRDVWLRTPPGPATAAKALQEACELFDQVVAGSWRWPDRDAPSTQDERRLAPDTLQWLIQKLHAAVVGERIGTDTWNRTYRPYLHQLLQIAGRKTWQTDQQLIEEVLRSWPPNTRARQMAHDRFRRLWKQAGWAWPDELLEMRGNGKAAASPEGVRAFTDDELQELRDRILRSSRLTTADLTAWDALAAFGLRPAELLGLELFTQDGVPMARVQRVKVSSKGASGVRVVPAVPPDGWPVDCFELVRRWREHGFPTGMTAARSPGQVLTQQLRRLREQKPVQIALDSELTAYGCRHAFALRLAQKLGLHPREAATLMGHSPQTHLAVYGRRLDAPKLLATVREKVMEQRQTSMRIADPK
jgi:integrase